MQDPRGKLVLTRRSGEQILLSHPAMKDPIRLTLLGINRNQVRLGFQSETGVKIYRAELLEKDQ